MGEQSPDIMPGNVVFKVKSSKHDTFVRKGNNLHLKMEIDVKSALLGFTTEVKHLDGHVVKLNIKSITKPGAFPPNPCVSDALCGGGWYAEGCYVDYQGR